MVDFTHQALEESEEQSSLMMADTSHDEHCNNQS
jgi:hypothetical protein